MSTTPTTARFPTNAAGSQQFQLNTESILQLQYPYNIRGPDGQHVHHVHSGEALKSAFEKILSMRVGGDNEKEKELQLKGFKDVRRGFFDENAFDVDGY